MIQPHLIAPVDAPRSSYRGDPPLSRSDGDGETVLPQ